MHRPRPGAYINPGVVRPDKTHRHGGNDPLRRTRIFDWYRTESIVKISSL